jgi:hypothetical protein
MIYTRLFTDNDGESHFASVKFEFTATEYVSDAPPVELSLELAATHPQLMRAPAGWKSDWHPSATRAFFFVLSGEWEVTASDGDSRRFAAGSALLVEDVTGKGHRSRVVSDSVAVMMPVEEG